MVSLRQMTKMGTVRDYMTVVTDCRELYQQLIKKDIIEKPGIQRKIWANSLELY